MPTDPVGQILDPLQGMSVDQAWDAVKNYVAHPMSNVSALLLSVTVILLILLAIALFLVYVLMPRERTLIRTRTYAPGEPGPSVETPAREPSDVETARRKATRGAIAFWGSGIGVALIILLGVGVAYSVTATNRYCVAFCHAQSKTVVAASTIHHADCAECHEVPGVGGFVTNTFSRTRMAVMALAGQKRVDALPVDSDTCLRCHAEILTETSEIDGGLRVAHAQIVDAGDPCTSCHINLGHTKDGYSQGMSRCVVCHDGVKASAQCDTCHVESVDTVDAKPGAPAQELAIGDFTYQLVDASKPYCDGCHDVAKECDPCHGVRMPHDDDFILGGHARDAAFEGKQRCWKCHTPEYDCSSPCHSGFKRSGITGHPPDWKSGHQIKSGQTTCGCHQWRSTRQGSMCPLCH